MKHHHMVKSKKSTKSLHLIIQQYSGSRYSSNADPCELLYVTGSWIRKFSIRIQIRIRKFSIRIQGKSSNFNFFPQNLSKKTQFQILSTMQLQIYKYTEDFEESENKLYLLMLFYISAEKSPNLRTNLIFIMAYQSWIRIRICISPYGSGAGSGSDFYYTNPDPHHCY